MGKNNRARRAAKAKRHAQNRTPTGSRTDSGAGRVHDHVDPEKLVNDLLRIAAHPPDGYEPLSTDALATLYALDAALVRRESERQVLRMLRNLWDYGWQPVEIARQVRRAAGAAVNRLAIRAIAADHATRAAATLDPRWASQLDRLEIPRGTPVAGWVDAWAASESVSWTVTVDAVVALIGSIAGLPRLATIIPPPGARSASDAVDLGGRGDDAMLDRVRALLAQAESTEFEAEAETFTAKAQELMTRHAIDAAMIDARADRSEAPITIRIPIDEPYVDAKSLLLQHVAEHSRCRAVFHPDCALSSVIGFADDVAAAELLFTSLLVQAQTAMNVAAASAPSGGRTRSRAFRSTFLVAYATRIGERLAEVNDAVITRAQTETGTAIVPVLAARSDAVDAATAEQFGELQGSAVRGGYDPAGWASGHLAADRARLRAGDLHAGSARDTLPAIQ